MLFTKGWRLNPYEKKLDTKLEMGFCVVWLGSANWGISILVGAYDP